MGDHNPAWKVLCVLIWIVISVSTVETTTKDTSVVKMTEEEYLSEIAEANEKVQNLEQEVFRLSSQNTAQDIVLNAQKTLIKMLKSENAKLNETIARLTLSCDSSSEGTPEPNAASLFPTMPEVSKLTSHATRSTVTYSSTTKIDDAKEPYIGITTPPPIMPGVLNTTAHATTSATTEEDSDEKECSSPAVEVLFVTDGSSSVGQENFDRVKSWIKTVARDLSIDEGCAAVGVLQYSHYFEGRDDSEQRWITTHIKIGEYTTYASFAAEVDKIEWHGYTTYTARALLQALREFQSSKNFNTTTTKQILILLTDGRSNDKSLLSEVSSLVRQNGIVVYAIGIADAIVSELRIIANGDASDPTRTYPIASFDDLRNLAFTIQREIQLRRS